MTISFLSTRVISFLTSQLAVFRTLSSTCGFYIIKRKLHGCLEIRNFSSHVEKYFTRSLRSPVKYFSMLEDKFRISTRPCMIFVTSKILVFWKSGRSGRFDITLITMSKCQLQYFYIKFIYIFHIYKTRAQ